MKCPVCMSPMLFDFNTNEKFNFYSRDIYKCSNVNCLHSIALVENKNFGVASFLTIEQAEKHKYFKEYDSFKRKYEKVIKAIISLHNSIEPKSILDFGTGFGHFAFTLLDFFPNSKVFCIEKNEVLYSFLKHKIMKEYAKYSVQICTNIDSLASNRFDLIVCTEVLEHLDSDSLRPIMHSLYRVLNDNGYIFLTLPLGRKRNGTIFKNAFEPSDHINFFSDKSFFNFFSQLPFSFIEYIPLSEWYHLEILSNTEYENNNKQLLECYNTGNAGHVTFLLKK